MSPSTPVTATEAPRVAPVRRRVLLWISLVLLLIVAQTWLVVLTIDFEANRAQDRADAAAMAAAAEVKSLGLQAVHLLQALNTGHDGSMATVHANSAADALARLSSLVLQQVGNWPLVAVQHHVARAVDVVVHVARGTDGARTVVEVAEVLVDVNRPTIAIRRLADESSITGVLQRGRR